METKFTKGEWNLPHFVTQKEPNDCDCGFVLAHDCEECVATVHYKKDDSTQESEHPDLETAIANAKLICAAPDMLKALIEIKQWGKTKVGTFTFTTSETGFNELILQVIKKATE